MKLIENNKFILPLMNT